MNRIGLIGVLGGASLMLAGCLGGGPKQDAGAGAVVGGFIGNEIGTDLDAADRRMAADAEYRALEFGRTGAPVGWHGRSGRYGDVVAGSAYRVNDTNCRDYTNTITIDGRPQVARGTACRQPDGTWRPVT